MSEGLRTFSSSLIVRLFIVLGLMLLFQLPVSMIGDLLRERTSRREEAVREVQRMSGPLQSVGSPLLHLVLEVPVPAPPDTPMTAGTTTRVDHWLMPASLDIASSVIVEPRYRGIFETSALLTRITYRGEFDLPEALLVGSGDLQPVPSGSLSIGMNAPRSLKEVGTASWGATPMAFKEAASGSSQSRSLQAPVPVRGPGRYPFEVSFTLSGSQGLTIEPVAQLWKASMTSNSPHPSFTGEVLPSTREVTGDGFRAQWHHSGLPPESPLLESGEGYGSDNRFGVSFLSGVDGYRTTERAMKYSILFVFLTYLLFFAFEVIVRLRIHPVQYLLVGAAVVLFYLLLLSLSEHIGFGAAYLLSAGSVVVLVTGYAKAVLAAGRRAGIVGGLLGVLYGYLYALLLEGDYALVSGSIGLTLLLGLAMYVTRRVDWYSLGEAQTDPV